MTTYKFGDDKNGAVIKDGLTDQIDAILNNLQGGIGSRVKTRVEAIVKRALPQIPVRSGDLKASTETYVRLTETEITVGAGMGHHGKAPYAYKVKFSKGLNKRERSKVSRGKSLTYRRMMEADELANSPYAGKSVFQSLIRKPMDAAVTELHNDVLDAMVEGAKNAVTR